MLMDPICITNMIMAVKMMTMTMMAMMVLFLNLTATTTPTTETTIFVSAEQSNSGCPACFDRSGFTIGVATHATSTDVFWTTPITALMQSAMDLGISLDMLEPASNNESEEEIESSMTTFIGSLCSTSGGSGDEIPTAINGLVTTLPSNNTALISAVQQCLDADIPVVVFNAGRDLIQAFSGPLLHYIGQDEYGAGKLAGERMVGNCPDCTFYW